MYLEKSIIPAQRYEALYSLLEIQSTCRAIGVQDGIGAVECNGFRILSARLPVCFLRKKCIAFVFQLLRRGLGCFRHSGWWQNPRSVESLFQSNKLENCGKDEEMRPRG